MLLDEILGLAMPAIYSVQRLGRVCHRPVPDATGMASQTLEPVASVIFSRGRSLGGLTHLRSVTQQQTFPYRTGTIVRAAAPPRTLQSLPVGGFANLANANLNIDTEPDLDQLELRDVTVSGQDRFDFYALFAMAFFCSS